VFSRNLTAQTNNAVLVWHLLAIVGILVLCFRIYWAFRYRRLAKRLQLPDRELHPRRGHNSSITYWINQFRATVSFLASEVTVAIVVAKALALPQGVAVYTPKISFVRWIFFVVLAI